MGALIHLGVVVNSAKDHDVVFQKIKAIADLQPKLDIRILTISLPVMPDDKVAEFFKFYLKKDFLNKEKIKVSIIGKWYELSSEAIDEVRKVLDETKDYDKYFLNFTINYDGQMELVDACKLICRQASAGKLNLEKISKSSIKDNLYSSTFVPPQIIICTGEEKKLNGFLLWDSVSAKIIMTGKDFSELRTNDIISILNEFF